MAGADGLAAFALDALWNITSTMSLKAGQVDDSFRVTTAMPKVRQAAQTRHVWTLLTVRDGEAPEAEEDRFLSHGFHKPGRI